MTNSEHRYEVCTHCHLFVEENPSYYPGADYAPFVHLSRDDREDEAIDRSHAAEPSGQVLSLSDWKKYGSVAMRARFEVGLYEGFLELQEHGIYDTYPLTALVEFTVEQYRSMALSAIRMNFGEFNEWLLTWERRGHGKIIMAARLDNLMPTV